ncbi:ABC transporter ATP-binding protein [Salinactinospora qingdaonensis]|uniref:ABC transporter ATP-binding protein n=1 Tax=Salinactinospora qingdaonensis TaxID=702744 RepID=A0ABP7G3E1_9ACTN
MREEPVLAVSELVRSFRECTALNGVSFTAHAGKVHGLLGPNGSGKTTCLHLITGLDTPDHGQATVLGVPVSHKTSRPLIGMAPDDLPLPGSLTGNEYLTFHHRLRQRDDTATAARLADAFNLSNALNRTIAEYSHGMKRKLQVIAAVMHKPSLLVLDEPFRGLDPDAAAVLRELITTFTQAGGAVLVATHDMLRAERDCDHVTLLHEGDTVAQGNPATLLEQHQAVHLEELFLSVTGLASQREVHMAELSDAFSQEMAT